MRSLLPALALTLASLGAQTAAHARPIPNGRWFWVEGASGWERVHATALATQRHVTVYGEPQQVSAATARKLASQFSQHIYPTDTRLFGLPRNLGRVSILLTQLDGMTLGYFNDADVQPAADPAHSNGGNILYVRTPSEMPDKNKLADVGEVCAHELQHLIDFRARVIDRNLPPEESWLNEGLSFYAQLANQYFTQADRLKIDAAANEPAWQVTSMPDSQGALLKHGRAAYGRAGLFVTYLANRFGSRVARAIIDDPKTGISAIDDALRSAHVSVSQVFADWGVASLLDQPGVYGYGGMSHLARAAPRLAHQVISTFPYDSDTQSSGLSVLPWSHVYFRFESRRDGTLTLTVQEPSGRARIALVTQGRAPVEAEVDWLHPDARGVASISVNHFGTQENAATLIIADTSLGASPDRFRVKASFIDAGENNGIT